MSTYLKNTTTGEITLHVGDFSVTVPAGANSPVGFAPGIAEIDSALLKGALKIQAVKGYFDEGKLVAEGKAPEPEPEPTQEAEPKQTK